MRNVLWSKWGMYCALSWPCCALRQICQQILELPNRVMRKGFNSNMLYLSKSMLYGRYLLTARTGVLKVIWCGKQEYTMRKVFTHCTYWSSQGNMVRQARVYYAARYLLTACTGVPKVIWCGKQEYAMWNLFTHCAYWSSKDNIVRQARVRYAEGIYSPRAPELGGNMVCGRYLFTARTGVLKVIWYAQARVYYMEGIYSLRAPEFWR